MLVHTVLLTWVAALLGTATAGSKVTAQQGAPLGLSQISGSEPGTYTYREPAGKGAYIYLLSSGIDRDHPDLGGRVEPGFDATDTNLLHLLEPKKQDKFSGTHLASTAAGTIYGVAKKATLVDIKVLREPMERRWQLEPHTVGAAQRGLEWAINDIVRKKRIGKAVISIPWAYRWDLHCLEFEKYKLVRPCQMGTELRPPLRRAKDLDVPIVMAAGNGDDSTWSYFPGGFDWGITVGAVDRYNRRWVDRSKAPCDVSCEEEEEEEEEEEQSYHGSRLEGSSYGHPIEIFAPSYAKAALAANEEHGTNGTDNWLGGTKTATAYVTGVVALMLAEERFARYDAPLLYSALYETAIPDVVKDSKTRRSRLLFNGGRDGFKAAPQYRGGSRGRFPSQRKKVGTWQ